MSVWRTVQETLYQRWRDSWVSDSDPLVPLTPYSFANETFDPPAAPWANFTCVRLPGGNGTMGRPGNRKMDRVGLVVIELREPPGDGVGSLTDLAERAAAIFENCRIIATHDIRFAEVEPGAALMVDRGRWWGVSIEGRFDYEDLR